MNEGLKAPRFFNSFVIKQITVLYLDHSDVMMQEDKSSDKSY